MGQLFNFPALVEQWQTRSIPLNRSAARAALQLTFVLQLEVDLVTGGTNTYAAQLVWTYKPNRVVGEFVDDWECLREHPLVYCRTDRDRRATGVRGRARTVDLSNVKTLAPVFGRDSGSFVAAYKKAHDISIAWQENLARAEADGLVTPATAATLRGDFESFRARYASAIEGFATEGLAHVDLVAQLHAYGTLLRRLCRDVKGDRNRDLLLRPLLQIGTVAVEGGHPTAIVTPWHPLRLAAMARKASLVAGLVTSLMAAERVYFGDTRLFFKDLKQELEHPFYPEVVLGWRGSKPVLLSTTDVVADYTLHESPLAEDDGSDETNENPTDAARQVLDLVRRYLDLYPHEQANLSVVLYNCDSARLPQAVVDRIGAIYEDEDDVRCQVILRHRDDKQLGALYERILESSDADPDSFNASEATQDFMARLRISIMAQQAPAPDPKDGRTTDIVFSQDVIARHASVEWYKENATPVDLADLVPPRWSRRRPAAKDDMKSVVYLCCPVQGEDGWWFLTALTSVLKGDWDGDEARRLLPGRQLNFQDPAMDQVLEETHNLGNWVVNYDELLDRRQLLNQRIRVIRYKQSATQGRNVIISSTAPLGLLRTMVLSRLKDLNLDADGANLPELAQRFIEDANDISGDIVLRAAKRGRNASELMGIVLSRFLIRHELGVDRYYGWYFLDDYAAWLGQREEQIADILVLSPEVTPDGRMRLTMVIVESKYIDADNLAAKRKESQKQLRDTVRRIDEALFGAPERLDRDLWLARLSDLILDGVQFPASAAINLADWRRAIREGGCEIDVRGYSHIFVSGPSGGDDCSDVVAVAGLGDAYQEVFGRTQVRQLVSLYSRDQDPATVREGVAGGRVWDRRTYRRPSDRGTTAIAPVAAPCDGAREASGTAPEAEQTPATGAAPPAALSPPDETSGVDQTSALSGVSAAADTPDRADTGSARWAYPGIALLLVADPQADGHEEADRAWLAGVEGRAKGALQQFQMRSKLMSGVLTPNAALLKFVGGDDLTVEQMLKRRSQFLTTHGLNIVSVQPEPGAVAVAIERPTRRIVRVQDLWRRWMPDARQGNRDLLIAMREDDGEALFLAPGTRHAPHTLIAGSTGSGKSVLLQNIILAIAATNTPRQARLTLIDPKQGVDYFAFDGLPHIEGGIVDEQGVALDRLRGLVVEMDARYARFKEARASNLESYNRKVGEAESLPVLWLIHDEFAEWMLIDDYKEEVTALVSRLGIKARAAGIYLVFAAQRPDANVMPMQLRANLGNRLILRVDSEGTSEIALGEKGAERLLGRGHLLARLEGFPLCYAQVPFVDEEFIEEFVRAVAEADAAGGG